MIEFMYVVSVIVTIMAPFILIAILLFVFWPALRREMLNDWNGK